MRTRILCLIAAILFITLSSYPLTLSAVDFFNISDSLLVKGGDKTETGVAGLRSDSISGNFNIKENPSGEEKLSEGKPQDYLPKWYEMISNIPGDYVRYYRTELTEENLPLYAGIFTLTAQLILADDITWQGSHGIYKSSTFSKNWSDIFTEIGDGRTQFALAAGFAAYGFIGGNNRALRTASQIVEAVLASGAVVQVLKHLTGRQSPYVSSQPGGVWRFFPNQILYHKHVPEYDAYPSGHIATSMAAFVVIAENYPEYKWIKPASYSLAALICIGMANKGIHWYSDYPLGIALGYAFGKMIAHPELTPRKETMEKKKKVEVSLMPYVTPAANGLSLGVSF
ncbi:MAG: phosphatase PAP2 family protein [Ignavibacteria bacterium]|jgi:membrane-associated phospholipid phosphatase|nr:phosphatase PAP2 family protein [Ignavibacteria bacterium]MCU7523294.1 phosphatase PAP2 family protein [Ignavibacteria bacterium]